MGLVNTILTGSQSWVIWGPIAWVATLKVGVLIVCPKLFAPQGEAGIWKFHPD